MVNALSLFSGCGGCSLGLQQAGFDVRLAADIDENACKTYARNLDKGCIWNVDLATITAADVLGRANVYPGGVNLIVGGPPCQGFSSAGTRAWEDPRNTLLRRFVELVTSIRPTWFVMENVEGLLTANAGAFLIESVTRFLESGYWVRVEKVYMERYGVPQRRKRVIIVGNLEGCNFAFPSWTYYERIQDSFPEQQLQLSIMDAISDLPAPSDSGEVIYQQQARNEYQAQMRRTDRCVVQMVD